VTGTNLQFDVTQNPDGKIIHLHEIYVNSFIMFLGTKLISTVTYGVSWVTQRNTYLFQGTVHNEEANKRKIAVFLFRLQKTNGSYCFPIVLYSEFRKRGNMETWRQGYGDMERETWKHENTETWRHGDIETWT
jgi:hypothetical protein